MKNPRAHEAAALALAAFAIAEAAEGLSDTRWALNRATAHLAMAQALQRRASGVDSGLAAAALLALTDRQRTAIAALDAITGRHSRSRRVAALAQNTCDPGLENAGRPAAATRLEARILSRARATRCVLASRI